jgi:hypothetical protein
MLTHEGRIVLESDSSAGGDSLSKTTAVLACIFATLSSLPFGNLISAYSIHCRKAGPAPSSWVPGSGALRLCKAPAAPSSCLCSKPPQYTFTVIYNILPQNESRRRRSPVVGYSMTNRSLEYFRLASVDSQRSSVGSSRGSVAARVASSEILALRPCTPYQRRRQPQLQTSQQRFKSLGEQR